MNVPPRPRCSLYLFAASAALIVGASVAPANTIRVPQDYPQIINAINAAQPNDLILVDPGVYNGFSWGNKIVTVRSTQGPAVTHIAGGVFFLAATNGIDRLLDGFSVTGDGDGIFSTQGGGGHVINCASINNQGRGMGAYESELYIENCLIAHNNLMWGFGGGITNQGGAIYATNVTVVGNLGADSAGIWDFSYFGQSTYTNCVVWDNGVWAIAGNASFAYCNTDPPQSGMGNISADPRFVDPANGNYKIAAGSPCIDAGSNLALTPEMIFDLAGLSRRVDDPNTVDTGAGAPPIVDMGAFEFQVNFGLALTVQTSCPSFGPATISWTGGTPGARVALLFAPRTGHFIIPNGRPCAGTPLALSPGGLYIRIGSAFTSDPLGNGSVTGTMPARACGGWMQLLDLGNCSTSQAVQVQ